MAELHIFILWENTLDKKEQILYDLSKNLKIIDVIAIDWNTSKFVKNLMLFYGITESIAINKAKNCGKGTFTLVIVEDSAPKYEYRYTLSGNNELVNINIFDKKYYYRSLFEKADIVHGSNNTDESFRDLLTLLGPSAFDYLYNTVSKDAQHSICRDPQIFNTGKTLTELFESINDRVEYVVIRNWDSLPHSIQAGEHFDLDLLTSHKNLLIKEWCLEKVHKSDNLRSQYKLYFKHKGVLTFGYVDIRTTDDHYFPFNIADDMLKRRVKNQCFFVPNAHNHLVSLLYHAAIHKGYISPEYQRTITEIVTNFPESNFNLSLLFDYKYILSYLNINDAQYVTPTDYSVASWLPNEHNYSLNRKLISYRILDKNDTESYISKVYAEDDSYIIKESSIIIGNRELKFLSKLNHTPYFPSIVDYKESNGQYSILKMSFVKGLLLSKIDVYDVFNTNKKIIGIATDFLKIVRQLRIANVIHRDIHPDNIIISPSGLPVIIDFGWAIEFDEQNPYCPFGLGRNYRPFDEENCFSDAYSLGKILEENFSFVPEIRNTIQFLKTIHQKNLDTDMVVNLIDKHIEELNSTQIHIKSKCTFHLKRLLFKHKNSKLATSIFYTINGSLKRDCMKLLKKTL